MPSMRKFEIYDSGKWLNVECEVLRKDDIFRIVGEPMVWKVVDPFHPIDSGNPLPPRKVSPDSNWGGNVAPVTDAALAALAP